jgi:hypothetical protein
MVLHSSWSILGMMVNTQRSSGWMVHNSSTQQMEMVRFQQCIDGLKVHSNRVQLLVLHRNQSRHMVLAHMISRYHCSHCMCNSQHMEMESTLRSRWLLMVRSSRVGLKTHNSMMTIQQ